MAKEDALEIQLSLADKYRAEKIAADNRLRRDIRPMIARSGWYHPDTDPEYVYHEFPKVVRDAKGKELGTAHNLDEELAILGKKVAEAKAVTVDLAQVAQTQEPPKAKRKYTKRAPVSDAPLPAPLK